MINYPELKNFFITEVSTIENAIKVIDNNGKGICLVIDSKNNLKGLLSKSCFFTLFTLFNCLQIVNIFSIVF